MLKHLVLSRFFSTLAFQLLGFWGFFEVIQSSGSPVQIAFVGLVLYLPTLLVGFFGGHLADRMRSVGKVYLLLKVLQLGIPLFLLLSGVSYFTLLVALLSISLLRGLRTPFYYSLQGKVKEGLSNNDLGRLSRFNTLSWQAPLVLAPLAISYLEMSTGASYYSILLIASCKLLSIIFALRTYAIKERVHQRILDRVPMYHSLRAVFRRRDLMLPIYMDTFLASMFGLSAFLPFFLSSVDLQASHFGYLKSLFHLMGLAGTVLMPRKILISLGLRGFSVLLGLWVLCVATMLFFNQYWQIALVIGSLGFIDGMSAVFREFVMISLSKINEMGKVAAVKSFLITTGDDLGEFNTGLLIALLGIPGFLLANFILGSLMLSAVFLKSDLQVLGSSQDSKPLRIKGDTI